MTMSVQHTFLDTLKAIIFPLTILMCAFIWGCAQSEAFLRFSVWAVLLGFLTVGCFYSGIAAERNQNNIFMGVLFLSLLGILITLLIKGVPFIFEGQKLGLF